MAISTNKDFNTLHDLLNVLANLSLTFDIDMVYYNRERSLVKVYYTDNYRFLLSTKGRMYES